MSPGETGNAAWRSRPGVSQARAPAAHASQAPGIQTGASAESGPTPLASVLWSYTRRAEATQVTECKCLLNFIVIIVFASRYIAMIAGFFLKLSIKY